MTKSSPPDEHVPESAPGDNTRIMIGAGVVLMVIGFLTVLAVILAINAKTAAPGVRVVRDLLIITMSLEVVIVGAGITIFLVQLARLINLARNEIEPLVEAVHDTVTTIRGTALFLSKNVVEPVTSISSVVRGLGKVAGDVDAIRKAAGIVVEVASAASPGGAVSNKHSSDTEAVITDVKSTAKSNVRRRKSTNKSKEA